MAGLLDIRAARRTFITPEGQAVAALDGIDLSVGDGEFITLLGPSGCGKTTLLRAIAGFEQIDDGAIWLDGRDITRLAASRRPVNTVFQSYALFPHMTVARNVGYALEVAGIARPQREAEVAAALEKVGLADFGRRHPAQLSGGQRQRVALARAIIAKPRLLLLDEPLSALDRNLRQQMQLELKDLQTRLGIAFVFVTHDQEEAMTMSDRVVVMRAGRIEQIGTPREIWSRPQTRFVAGFIGETNLLPASVGAILEGRAELLLPGGITITAPAHGLRTGMAVTAMIRPQDLQLASDGIPARVKRCIYTGGSQLIELALEGSEQPVSVIVPDRPDLPAPDARVFLSCDPMRVHVMDNSAAGLPA